jgi:hypothetical protein
MDTKNLHNAIVNWAQQTDPRIQVEWSWNRNDWDLFQQTTVELEIHNEVTGQRPHLGMIIPHGHRTPMYFYGPDTEDTDQEESLPLYSDEDGLRSALGIVYRRFMTAHGMMRFDDSQEPMSPFYRPDLLEIANKWLSIKDGPKYTLREIPANGSASWKSGIELFPSTRNPCGMVIKILRDRSLPQHYLYEKTGAPAPGTLPAFYTESEILGYLAYAGSVIDGENKDHRKNKTNKPNKL